MSTSGTITLTASEAVGHVTVTCAVSLSGTYTYDIVLHQDESHSGNARGLTFNEAHEYLSMLFDTVEYQYLLDIFPHALARVTSSVMGGQ